MERPPYITHSPISSSTTPSPSARSSPDRSLQSCSPHSSPGNTVSPRAPGPQEARDSYAYLNAPYGAAAEGLGSLAGYGPPTHLPPAFIPSYNAHYPKFLLPPYGMNCNGPMNCLPGSSVHGILQATIMEWVAVFFSRVSSQARNRTHVFWPRLLHCWQVLYP